MDKLNNIPFYDLSQVPEQVQEEWLSAIDLVIKSGRYVNGPTVTLFESNWSNLVGTKYAIGVGNGLDGLSIALEAMGIGDGDLVAVPAHTFIASWIAIDRVGAIPVGIEVNELGLLDVQELSRLKEAPKAVMPVHMHGTMCDMPEIMKWAKTHSVKVIEDASQSHFAKSNGTSVGAFGDVGVFSLYPTKNLGALGDAGIVVTNNLEIAESVREKANYGSSKNNKYLHTSLGSNSRLDSIQAAILDINLRYAGKWNEKRREIAKRYQQECEKLNIKVLQNVTEINVFHHFVVQTKKRDTCRDFLSERGIQTEIHYPKNAALEYAEIKGLEYVGYPIAEKISETSISLPLSPWMTLQDIQRVVIVLEQAKNAQLLNY